MKQMHKVISERKQLYYFHSSVFRRIPRFENCVIRLCFHRFHFKIIFTNNSIAGYLGFAALTEDIELIFFEIMAICERLLICGHSCQQQNIATGAVGLLWHSEANNIY